PGRRSGCRPGQGEREGQGEGQGQSQRQREGQSEGQGQRNGRLTRLALEPSALLSASEDGYLVYDVEAERLHRLNPAASLVIELCDGSREVDQIRQLLLPLLGDAGWEACRRWIDRAVQDGWLTAVADSSDTPSPSAGALSTLAAALRDRDRVLAAFICQQRAAELSPDDPRMWYRLGELAHIVG